MLQNNLSDLKQQPPQQQQQQNNISNRYVDFYQKRQVGFTKQFKSL